MLRQRLVLVVVAGSVSFGTGAALAATHSSSHPAKKPPVVRKQLQKQMLPRNVHYGCHHDHSSGAANAALNL